MTLRTIPRVSPSTTGGTLCSLRLPGWGCLCAVLIACVLANPPQGEQSPSADTQQPKTAVDNADHAEDQPTDDELEARTNNVTFAAGVLDDAISPGSTLTLALRYAIAPGWHVYWPGLNDTGYPPKWRLQLPDGWSLAGDPQWPAPKRYVSPGDILDHVHEGELVVLLPVRLSADAPTGEVDIRIESDWLVCKDACIAEQSEVSLRVRVAGAPPESSSRETDAGSAALRVGADRTRARLPKPWSELRTAHADAQAHAIATRDNPRIGALTIRVPGAAGLSFFPDRASAEVSNLLAEGDAPADTLRISLKQLSPGSRVRGVVEVRTPSGAPSWFWIDIPVASSKT